MNERDAWRIIESNLPKLVEKMVTLRPNESAEVFCDPPGRNLSFGKPVDQMNVKLCRITPPDLEGSYDVHRDGNTYVNGDGEEILGEELPTYLTRAIRGMKDGGSEWGWEFKLS